MKNELMIFKGKEVEVLVLDGKALFNPYDCGKCLDLGKSAVRMAIGKMNKNQVTKLKNSDVKDIDTRKLNNAGENFLTESGVYKLAFKSQKKEAKEFQDWVTDEVLPSIRKHGMYAKDELLDNPDLMIEVITKLKKEREEKNRLENKIKKNKPKVLFADAVSTSKTSILVGELAKILRQNGINTGQNRLFAWLRDNGYLIKRKGTDYNMPTQKSMDLELFKIKETSITHSDGHVSISKTPKVTGKGQVYFINKFKNMNLVEVC